LLGKVTIELLYCRTIINLGFWIALMWDIFILQTYK